MLQKEKLQSIKSNKKWKWNGSPQALFLCTHTHSHTPALWIKNMLQELKKITNQGNMKISLQRSQNSWAPAWTNRKTPFLFSACCPSLPPSLSPPLTLSLPLSTPTVPSPFFGRWYGGPRCYISLANGEQRGAGSVLHSRCPLLLKSSCLQLSNSTHMRKSCGSTGSITHTWQPEAAASSRRRVHFFPSQS